jgi:hypothetical protein
VGSPYQDFKDLLLEFENEGVSSGSEFQDSYSRRQLVSWHDTPVTIVSREDLIVAKRAAAQPDRKTLSTPLNLNPLMSKHRT